MTLVFVVVVVVVVVVFVVGCCCLFRMFLFVLNGFAFALENSTFIMANQFINMICYSTCLFNEQLPTGTSHIHYTFCQRFTISSVQKQYVFDIYASFVPELIFF